ncbi:MAG: PAS domain S-box protein [Chthoniobacterales bacterium]
MKKKSQNVEAAKETFDEISVLVRQLDQIHRRLQELAGGELDSVLLPGGHSYLLHQAQEKLRQNDAVQSSILNALPAHIALIDSEGTILSVNNRWKQFAQNNGLQPSRCGVGQNYLQICEAATGDCSEEAFEAAVGIRAVLRGELNNYALEYPCHSPDEQRWFQLMVTKLDDTAVSGAVVMHVDVTERKLAEETLQESETLFHSLFENMLEGCAYCQLIYEGDRAVDFVYLRVNPAFEKHTGLKDVAGKKVSELVPGLLEASPEILETYHRVAKTGRTEQFEVYAEHLDIWFSVSAYSNEPGYFTAVLANITERKKAEGEIRFNEQRFRSLVEATSDIVWDTPASGKFESEQPGWSAFTGQTFEEYGGAGWLSAIHPDDQEETFRVWNAAVATRSIYKVEHRIRARDQTYRYMNVRAVPVLGEEGEIRQWIGIHTNISERKLAEETLRESEERFSGAFEHAPIGIALVAPDGHWLKVNRAVCKMLGYTEEELLARTFQEITHPEDLDADLSLVREVLEGKRLFYQLNKRYIHKDGHSVPASLSVSLVRDTRNEPLYFVSHLLDISARVQTENELLRIQQRLALATQSAHIGVWDWDVAGDKMIWDAQMYALYGIRERDFSGAVDAWQKGLHPQDRERAVADITDALKGRRQFHSEFRVVWPSGAVRDIEAHGIVQRSSDGQPQRMIGVNWDVTDRKKSERQMAEQAALLDMAPDAIMVRDLKHRIIYWNKSAERLYGWTSEEARGQIFVEMLKVDHERFYEAEAIAFETGEWAGEMQKTNRFGTVLTLNSRWTLVRNSDGTPHAILVIDTDISERKKLEQQFLRSQRMESIGTLAGGIAHDLNNSLAPILMSIELLKMKYPESENQELFANISASAERGADMVRQLLSFARGVTGKRIEVDIRHIVGDIEKIARDTFLKHIQIRTVLPDDVWPVIGDATQLHQVILNLCVNARDAMPGGGGILTLSAENVTLSQDYIGLNTEAKAGPYVVVRVEDTGTGMPADVINKIFDPFFTTKEIGKGTGLGLSITYGIVQEHGGNISCESNAGQGTRFTLTLPLATARASERAQTANRQA